MLTEDGGLIEGTAVVGNSGMFRGAGHFRARRWFKGDSPILFEMDGGAADVDVAQTHDSVRIGSALIGRLEDGEHWSMRFSHEQANAIVRVDPGGPPPPMATGITESGQWTVSSPISNGRTHGWFTAGRRGGIFEGKTVTLHRGGDGHPRGGRETAVILGRVVSIGLDLQADRRLLWARVGDATSRWIRLTSPSVPTAALRSTFDRRSTSSSRSRRRVWRERSMRSPTSALLSAPSPWPWG